MKKTLIFSLLLTSIVAHATTKIDENNIFISLGLEKSNDLPFSANNKVITQWRPKIGLGVEHSYHIEDDWQVDHQLVLQYSKANATLLSTEQALFNLEQSLISEKMSHSGQLQTTSLWLKNRLSRENLFANAAPFLELDAGTVHQRLDPIRNGVFKERSSQQLVYKALVGIRFDVIHDVDISIAVGHQNDIN